MPNIPPMITHMPDAQPLYAAVGSGGPTGPTGAIGATGPTGGVGVFGTASNITWGIVSGTVVLGAISVPSLTNTGIVQVTIQTQDASDIGDAVTLVVMQATPSSGSGGQIRVYLNRAPLVTANLVLSWQVLRF
jgi:hypothetical protein